MYLEDITSTWELDHPLIHMATSAWSCTCSLRVFEHWPTHADTHTHTEHTFTMYLYMYLEALS